MIRVQKVKSPPTHALMVQLREEANASPFVCGVQGVGTPDKDAMGESRQGLRVGEPEGTGGQAFLGR